MLKLTFCHYGIELPIRWKQARSLHQLEKRLHARHGQRDELHIRICMLAVTELGQQQQLFTKLTQELRNDQTVQQIASELRFFPTDLVIEGSSIVALLAPEEYVSDGTHAGQPNGGKIYERLVHRIEEIICTKGKSPRYYNQKWKPVENHASARYVTFYNEQGEILGFVRRREPKPKTTLHQQNKAILQNKFEGLRDFFFRYAPSLNEKINLNTLMVNQLSTAKTHSLSREITSGPVLNSVRNCVYESANEEPANAGRTPLNYSR